MFVAPDRYILNIIGPYFSNSRNNDANILIQELQENIEGLREWFVEWERDIFSNEDFLSEQEKVTVPHVTANFKDYQLPTHYIEYFKQIKK